MKSIFDEPTGSIFDEPTESFFDPPKSIFDDNHSSKSLPIPSHISKEYRGLVAHLNTTKTDEMREIMKRDLQGGVNVTWFC